MPDIILLKPVDQISTAGLGRGEIAIDEDGRRLVIHTGDIPLDVVPVPEPTQEDIDEGRALVMGTAGPIYAALTTGAGGTPLDAGLSRWTVPGIIPTLVYPNQTISSTWTAEIEISEPCKVTAIRSCPIGGVDITLNYGIRELDGSDLFNVVESSYAGPVDTPVDLDLEPGRYLLYMTVADAVEFQVLIGYLPWARAATFYPLYLRVDTNAAA